MQALSANLRAEEIVPVDKIDVGCKQQLGTGDLRLGHVGHCAGLRCWICNLCIWRLQRMHALAVLQDIQILVLVLHRVLSLSLHAKEACFSRPNGLRGGSLTTECFQGPPHHAWIPHHDELCGRLFDDGALTASNPMVAAAPVASVRSTAIDDFDDCVRQWGH